MTKKEIYSVQLQRINEKAGTDLRLGRKNGHYYLYSPCDGMEFPPVPFSNVMTMRKCSEMADYLAGLEDAITYYTRRKD